MFDLSRLGEGLASWITGATGTDSILSGDLLSNIASSGIDIGALQGLPADEIMSTLASSGIDLSALSEQQVGDLLQSLGVDRFGG